MYTTLTPPPKKKFSTKWLVLGAVVLVGLLAVLELTNTTHLLHKKAVPVSASPYTKGEIAETTNANAQESGNASGTTDSQPGDTKSASGGSPSAVLIAPTGDFVSNHHPNLDGSPAPNTMSSVCTTTPGATCTIAFTKDGVTKSLPVQTADRGGSTYWNWKLQDIGLTAGSWKIEARAMLGGKTSTAADAMELVVAQ
jgi:hypothetical protein